MTVEPTTISIADTTLPVYSTNTLIIGSGAAALNSALQLHERGVHEVMIVTEHWGAGASFEAGSDKQTYYKLSLAHDGEDSPLRMAEDLFSGGCMHGDIALCEAHHSAQAFFHLVHRGVPFPHDEYGAYVGYRTDHDPAGRATSAGPLTSRMMCECLGRAVRDKGIPVLDHHQVIALLSRDEAGERSACGAVAIDTSNSDGPNHGLVVFNALNVILATGGPGGMYQTSVYPESQVGSTGLGLAIGAVAQNLTESQFGLASVGFRWNLSGSYQQVIPRYLSTDADGGDEREFLNDYFPDLTALTGAIFHKGYQWPFDCRKVAACGSSLIDVLVHRETVDLGRRVFLDFTQNPAGASAWTPFSLNLLDEESRSYLQESNALQSTPIERLRAMNEPAYQLYLSHGIDLASDRLQIAVCAQHNNGGLKGNIWWESNIRHLFPVGEVNGSHGVHRPGGSALNAGQVGGIRSAMFIAHRYCQSPRPMKDFAAEADPQVMRILDTARRLVGNHHGAALHPDQVVGEIRNRMTKCASIARRPDEIARVAEAAWSLLDRCRENLVVSSPDDLAGAFRAMDLCLTHAAYLEAIAEYLRQGGGSRGSCLVLDRQGQPCHERLGDEWNHRVAEPDAPACRRILEISVDDAATVYKRWVDVRPVPREERWFERVWRDHLDDRVVT
ncbi:MAG: FAD-binding protein [Phycisphaerales bacterium]|nr:MAG: FAD-binding protein [Phycisphaerales bacterium]